MKQVDLQHLFEANPPDEKYQLYRKLWQETEKYETLTSFPLHLDIELSSVCNLKCEFCFQNGLLNGPLGFMEFDLFKKIIDEGIKKGLCAIKLQIRGESLLHPKFFECVAYAKEKGVLEVLLTTNATLLNDDKLEDIFSSGLDGIIFSVDEHHEIVFDGKQKKTYSDVEKKIYDLLQLRIKMGKAKPSVRVQSSIFETDLPSFNKRKQYLKEKFSHADLLIVNRINDFRYDHDAYPDLHMNYDFDPCSYLTQRMAIFWDGNVTTCCGDYNNHFQLGNVNEQTIQKIWLSPKMSGFRKLHIEDKRTDMAICKHCHACLVRKDESAMLPAY